MNASDFTKYLQRMLAITDTGLTFTKDPFDRERYEDLRSLLSEMLNQVSDLDAEEVARWEYLKGSKSEERTNKTTGFAYHYSEGKMAFPDALDKASRTIITGEGGSAPSRFKHVILTPDNRYRRLTPIELERLNMFPDNHTKGCTDVRRAFLMGNALVTGIVEKMGLSLLSLLHSKG